MAELADAPDLGSGIHDVQVQVLSSAVIKGFWDILYVLKTLIFVVWHQCWHQRGFFINGYKEDTSILLDDGIKKIFLNAVGELDDVSKELKAFLDYVAGKKSDDSFVKKLEEAVKKAKENRECYLLIEMSAW